ncbi:MAG: immunoglobulin domain-containing protein, partial [Limisphaerales bacterium]
SSEVGYDFLIFYLNGVEQARISGQTAWAQRIVDLPSGNNTLLWKYVKDESMSDGLDKGFLDEVYFLGLPPTITSHPTSASAYQGSNVTFTVSATGTAPLNYQWRRNGANIAGATGSSLNLSNLQPSDSGAYSVVVRNAAGAATSANANLDVCNITLSSNNVEIGASGGSGSFSITSVGVCSWTVSKTNDWITFVSPATGSGNGTFQFTVAPNTDSQARASFLTVGNRKIAVRQRGASAPQEIRAERFTMVVTNGSLPLPSNESFLLDTADDGSATSFRRVLLTGPSAGDQGSYTFTRNSSVSATLITAGNQTNTITLTYQSPGSGTFHLERAGGGSQSGYFNSAPRRLDFNGDGFEDILWQSTDGVLAAWCMQGAHFAGAVPLRNQQPLPKPWRVVAAGDLQSRNEIDVILQNTTTGQLATWMMSNGTNFLRSVFLRNGTPLAAGWNVVGMGDFNQDQKPDLVLQHQDARAAVWMMDGTNFLGARLLREGIAPVGWRIVGVGDFDGDREDDLLYQHRDGRLLAWHFINGEFVAATSLRTASPDWQVVGLSDYNYDGKVDLLFQHTDRRMAVWFMNHTEFISGTLLRNGLAAGAAWRVVAPK